MGTGELKRNEIDRDWDTTIRKCLYLYFTKYVLRATLLPMLGHSQHRLCLSELKCGVWGLSVILAEDETAIAGEFKQANR